MGLRTPAASSVPASSRSGTGAVLMRDIFLSGKEDIVSDAVINNEVIFRKALQ